MITLLSWRMMKYWVAASLLLLAASTETLAADRDGLTLLVQLLVDSEDSQLQSDVLVGIAKGLEGRREVPMPSNWPQANVKLQSSPDRTVRDRAIQLSLLFNDPGAVTLLRDRTVDENAAAEDRQRAIELLVARRDKEFDDVLVELVDSPPIRRHAIRGLAEYQHARTVDTILKYYEQFDLATRQDALQTLASRRSWANQLVAAIESKVIAAADLSAFTVRQLHSLGDRELTDRVRQVWGDVRSTPADKARLIAKYKSQLTDEFLARADLSAGRKLFNETCATCHTLFGSGKRIGPDITGSQRSNLDYILENLIDPSAAVSRDYQMQVIVTDVGRVVTGLLIAENNQAITVQTANERVVIPLQEVDERKASPVSMMPDGQLQKLSNEEVRDLIAYLGSKSQVPLPDGED